jgi:hypothetical protein
MWDKIENWLWAAILVGVIAALQTAGYLMERCL